MMKLKKINSVLFFLSLAGFGFAQDSETKTTVDTSSSTATSTTTTYTPPSTSSSAASSKEESNNEFIFKPSVGLGTGMFSFYGDLYTKHFQAPMLSRIGYELNIAQRFTDYLQFNFYALSGTLGANENYSANKRSANFESQIRLGGVNLLYDFGNFLPKTRTASPYISVGIESFEFLSKTDMYDQYGNKYNYWSDGSIRNVAENSPDAGNAKIIYRDYTYESDIRQKNIDGFGKYAERSWAIPVGAGVLFKINDFINFKVGATMHFTFTDYIDGITEKSVGDRAGNKKNDNFMMSSCSLSYNFGIKKKDAKDTINEEDFKNVDFIALESDDQDKDGVMDVNDSCQGTPAGVPVDVKGCPLDDDKDGVPNYVDDELNSPLGSIVDAKGVQMSDSLIAYQYNFYMDSTGAFAKVEVHDHNGNTLRNSLYQKEYTVELGTFKKGLPPELMTKFLSISDIVSTNIDDSTTTYTAGKYNTLLDAENRKKQLVAAGMADAKVVYKKDGKFVDAPKYLTNAAGTTAVNTKNGNNGKSNNTNSNNNSNNKNTSNNNGTANNNASNNNDGVNMDAVNEKGLVLRVQLGAYHNRLSKSVFKNIDDLIEIKTEDGLYKYMTGSFKTFDAAAKHKIEILLDGYQGAFITAYKDGKRIALQDAGATAAKKSDNMDVADSASVNTLNKKLVIFKVQVGVFKNDPPADKMAIYAKIKDLNGETTSTGLKRYVVGSFNDYKEAQALKDKMVKTYGIEDAFVIAYYKNENISIPEALELQK